MKRSTIAAFALMCSASFAFAGGGAPVPPKQEGGDASGRPAALLDDAKCQTVWSQTDHESDVLSDETAKRMIDALPGARLVVVPDAGHTVPGDQPAAFQALLREFLMS